MRTLFVAIFVVLGLSLVGYSSWANAAACDFKLGFKTIRDEIPNHVGDCFEDEWHNPTNGNTR
jgi:hypothetical protein